MPSCGGCLFLPIQAQPSISTCMIWPTSCPCAKNLFSSFKAIFHAPILLHLISNAFFCIVSISTGIMWPTIPTCIFDSDLSQQQINYFYQTSNKQKLGNFTMKNKHPKTTTNFKIILVGEEPNYYSSVSCVNQPKKKTVMEAIRIINEVWTPSRPFILCF